MKKILIITILFYYIILSSVKVIGLHFCHGDLQSLALLKQVTSCCQDSKMSAPSCCNDLIITIDINDDQLSPQLVIRHEPVSIDLLPISHHEINSNQSTPEENISIIPKNEPPPLDKFIKYHSFLFYG